MAKEQKKLWRLLAAAAGLFFIYIIFVIVPGNNGLQEQAEIAEPLIVLKQSLGVKQFSVAGPERFTFFKVDDEWFMEHETLPLNQRLMNRLALGLEQFTALRRLSFDEISLPDDYGLGKPLYTITVEEAEGGAAYKIFVGSRTPSGESYYVRTEDDRDIYLVSAYFIEPFIAGREAFLEQRTAMIDWQKLTRITIKNAFNTIELAVNPQPEVMGVGAWLMVSPWAGTAVDDNELLKKFLNFWHERFTFSMQEMIAHPQSLKLYGLDKPRGDVAFYDADGRELHLLIGASAREGVSYYLKEADKASVFTADSEMIDAALNLRAFDIISKFAAIFNLDDVRGIEIYDDKGHHYKGFIRRGRDNAESYSFNDKSISAQAFRNYYTDFLAVFFEGLNVTQSFNANAIEITMIYHLKNRKELVMEFSASAAKNYYDLRYDRRAVAPFIVGKYQLQRLLDKSAQLEDNASRNHSDK
jgi:hypothetical protein